MNRTLISRGAGIIALLLAGCSGGGSSGGGGGGPPPTISITSPANGARVAGAASVAVTGTVTDATTVTVATNGGTAVAAAVSGGTFTATLTLEPRDNAVVATATNSAGTATATTSVYFPFLALTTFQDASVVIGEPDFVSTSGTTFSTALYGNPGWDGNQLYLPDYGWGDVEAFTGVPAANGASPAFTITTVNGGTASESPLSGPETLAYDGKLFLDDYDLNRVLIFDTLPTADGAAASVAIGQPDLTSTGFACTASGLYDPESAFVVGNKLIVADSENNRVLIWNAIPAASGAPADLVLGQPDFASCNGNAGGSVSGATFSYPTDIWSDGTRLLVADDDNNRILGWNTFPTQNGQAADFVLGQADLTSVGPNLGRGGLAHPYYLTSNGNQLFVADSDNNRIVVWNTIPSTTGALPDAVLGQADFDHGTPNDANQDGVDDGAPSAKTLNFPAGILALDGALIVTDGSNGRFLVFR